MHHKGNGHDHRGTAVDHGAFLPENIHQVTHGQRRDQCGQAAGGDQRAEQRLVVSQAEDIKVE